MKHLLFFLLPFVLYSCTTKNENIDQFFTENSKLPLKADSAFIASMYNNEYFQELNGQHLKALYFDVKKYNKLNENYAKKIIERDSLQASGTSEEEISKDYSFYEYTKFFALHKTKLNEQITAYSWYFYESVDMNQGIEYVFVTLYKKNKPYSCFRLGLNRTYSDSPVWSQELEFGEINKDGKIVIDQFSREGEYSEESDDIINSVQTKVEYAMTLGDIEEIKTDTISKYSSEDDKKTEGLPKTPLADFQNSFAEKELPANIDSVFISKLSAGEYTKLNAGQVLTLGEEFKEIANIYAAGGTIKEFIKIDSLEAIEKYEEYVETIEAGMTEISNAYAIYKYSLEDGTSIHIWSISDESAESGPWSKGTIVFASFVKENTVLKCYPIAEISFGGDAPMWGATKIECRITDSGEFQIFRASRFSK